MHQDSTLPLMSTRIGNYLKAGTAMCLHTYVRTSLLVRLHYATAVLWVRHLCKTQILPCTVSHHKVHLYPLEWELRILIIWVLEHLCISFHILVVPPFQGCHMQVGLHCCVCIRCDLWVYASSVPCCHLLVRCRTNTDGWVWSVWVR